MSMLSVLGILEIAGVIKRPSQGAESPETSQE